MKKSFEQLWDFFEKHSRSGPVAMGTGTRVAASLLVIGTIAFVLLGSSSLMNSDRFVDPLGLNLSGEWEFQNQASADCADPSQPSGHAPCFSLPQKNSWPYKVQVPKPLSEFIKEPLAKEFWYRKSVVIPDNLFRGDEDLSITLGSTKGKHSIWVNGHYLATGEELSLANHPLPKFFVGPHGEAEIVVRVAKTETLFPGIVHLTPMQIGRTKFLSKQSQDFNFQSGSKPLIPTIFKSVLFMAFIALFIAMPMRREYLFFSIYCFFSASTSFLYWRYQPFYDDYFFRQKLIFWAIMASSACVPLFVVEFFRFRNTLFRASIIYSGFILATPILSTIWVTDNAKRILLYQTCYGLIPWVIYIPAIVFSLSCSIFLYKHLKIRHRAVQGFLLAGCFVACSFFGNLYFAKFFSFSNAISPDLLDIGTFCAMAALMIGDFKSLYSLLQKSKTALPSIVARLFAVGVKQAVVDFRAVALVVDVVGYTKQLAVLSGEEKDKYNSLIKEIIAPIIEEFKGEKISDTGDGGVYLWEFKDADQEMQAIENALESATLMVEKGRSSCGVHFRIGLAKGEIKCHFHSPNFSFLGDPINIASRLEASAEIDQVLVHESIEILNKSFIEEKFVTYTMKGAPFLARPIFKRELKLLKSA